MQRRWCSGGKLDASTTLEIMSGIAERIAGAR
jgi:hypothetical protein